MTNVKSIKLSVLRWLKKLSMQLVYVALCFLYGANSAIAEDMIVTKGYTQTSLITQGNVTAIRTKTVVGANAYNAFSKFDVHQGKTVNLYVPDGAQNLLNLIYDKQSNINGTLNAYKNGQIGGNVYFANPHGLIVGKAGVVNVGRLTVTTPTEQFMNGFFDGQGSPSSSATQHLLNGTAPLNSAAIIDIQGQVNSIGSIHIRSGYLELSGELNNAPTASIVNLSGQASATDIKEVNGEIILFASNDIAITGGVHANGAENIDAGVVDIRSGGDIHLSENAQITAKGVGDNSDGGTVIVFADNDASIRDNATLDASSTGLGDAGFVEFSAKKTVELAGGYLLASAEVGTAGTVLIDPENIIISTDLLRDSSPNGGDTGEGTLIIDGVEISSNTGVSWNAGSLNLEASNKITVNADTTISTRAVTIATGQSAVEAHINNDSTADSGDLTLTAKKIELLSGSKLLANANNGYSAGDITLTAVDDASSLAFGGEFTFQVQQF